MSDVAVAAGIFEGEGSVRISKATKRNLGHLVCSVVNTDIEIVEFFNDRWPGYRKPATGLRAAQKPAFVWLVAARKAADFMEAIRPYAITTRMKKRIALGLDFQAQKSALHNVCRSDEYHERQWIYYMEMKELNLRGVAA